MPYFQANGKVVTKPERALQAPGVPWDALPAPPKEGTTMRAYKPLAAGIGTLLLGLAAAMPAQAGLSVNGLSVNGLSVNGLSVNGIGLAAPTQQVEPLALKVLSVTLPAAKAE
jgi:hypothetical protein